MPGDMWLNTGREQVVVPGVGVRLLDLVRWSRAALTLLDRRCAVCPLD